jgi:dUTP pyrophosphatase
MLLVHFEKMRLDLKGLMPVEVSVNIVPLTSEFVAPYKATTSSAGFDISYPYADEVVLMPWSTHLVQMGFSVEIPDGYEAQIRSRSGMSLKHGIVVLNSPGTIDSDYRGEVGVILHNVGRRTYVLRQHTRVAQMVFAAVAPVNLVLTHTRTKTERDGGFGSTGGMS